MPESTTTLYQIDQMDMLSMSMLALFLGMYVNRKMQFLRENYIPPAVTGGLIFSGAVVLLYALGDIELEFDMRARISYCWCFSAPLVYRKDSGYWPPAGRRLRFSSSLRRFFWCSRMPPA